MKRTVLLLLIVAFSANINAQTLEKKWGVGLGIGAYGTFENGGVGAMPELYLTRYLTPKFDLMFQGDIGIWRTNVKSNLDLVNPFLNLRYKLTDETKKLRPYVYAGPGYLSDNASTGINFDLGIGTKYYIKPNIACYGKGGYTTGIKVAGQRESFWNITVGIEYDFGKAKDSDKDGVADTKDKCPRTPKGVKVDAKGCPLDSDGDGVPDSKDKCPTVFGLVKLKGCPDKDGDGIADKDDACPDAAGPAKLKGCPDTDGDGIPDKNDKCPNTPKGSKVDASGCPLALVLDTDNDGVPDSEDNCPTVAGTKENKGCPAKPAIEAEKPKVITRDQVEVQNIKVEPIYFDSGKNTLMKSSYEILDKLILILNKDKTYNVNIYGYTDSKGTDVSNMKLAESRIESARMYLEAKGISDNRITKQQAFGASKPVASNDTEEGRLLNRRVEFEIFKMK